MNLIFAILAAIFIHGICRWRHDAAKRRARARLRLAALIIVASQRKPSQPAHEDEEHEHSGRAFDVSREAQRRPYAT